MLSTQLWVCSPLRYALLYLLHTQAGRNHMIVCSCGMLCCIYCTHHQDETIGFCATVARFSCPRRHRLGSPSVAGNMQNAESSIGVLQIEYSSESEQKVTVLSASKNNIKFKSGIIRICATVAQIKGLRVDRTGSKVMLRQTCLCRSDRAGSVETQFQRFSTKMRLRKTAKESSQRKSVKTSIPLQRGVFFEGSTGAAYFRECAFGAGEVRFL